MDVSRKQHTFAFFPAIDATILSLIALHFWLRHLEATSAVHLPAILTYIASAIAAITVWRLAYKHLSSIPYRKHIFICAIAFFFATVLIFSFLLPAMEIMLAKKVQFSNDAELGSKVELYKNASYPTPIWKSLMNALILSPAVAGICWVTSWSTERFLQSDPFGKPKD